MFFRFGLIFILKISENNKLIYNERKQEKHICSSLEGNGQD